MEFLLIIIVALLAIIAVVVIFNFLGNRRARQAEQDALRERTYRPGDPFSSADDDSVYGDPRDLKPGDLVELRGRPFEDVDVTEGHRIEGPRAHRSTHDGRR